MIKRPKTPQRPSLLPGKNKPSHQEDDFYANMAALSDDDDDYMETDVSEADVDLVAKSLDDLDDMDANLFGSHKKNTEKPLAKTVSSPGFTTETKTTKDPTTSNDNSVSKPTKKEFEASKPSVEDEIDLTGLLSDDDSSFLQSKKPSSNTKSPPPPPQQPSSSITKPSSIPKSSTINKETSQAKNPKETTSKDDSELSGIFSEDDESLLLPTTGKDKKMVATNEDSPVKSPSTNKSQNITNPVTKETKEPALKKAVKFSKDDDILDLGLEEKSNETSRPSRSALDDLFGKSSPPATPLDFNTNKTEKSKAEKLLMDKKSTADTEKGSDDFLFGSYLPSSAASQSVLNNSGRNSRLDAKDEKLNNNKRSENLRPRQKNSFSPKTSFDYDDDDDDDNLDWLKISSQQKSKTFEKQTEKTKVDEDDDDDDWLGMKSCKKSVSFNFEDGLDFDLSLDIPTSHGHIRGGARNENEVKAVASTSSVSECKKEELHPQSTEMKKTLETKPVVQKSNEISSPRKESPKKSNVEKTSAPIKIAKKVIPSTTTTTTDEEDLLQQLESVNLMPTLGLQPVPNLEPQNLVTNMTSSTKSLNMLPLSIGKEPSSNVGPQHPNDSLTIPKPNTVVPSIESQSVHNLEPQQLLLSNSYPTNISNYANIHPHTADPTISSSSFGKLTDAEVKINRLLIEKEQLEILVESVKKRCSEEIQAIEHSYRSRLQLLEETHEHKEKRWKEENEQLLKQHLQKMQQLEEEKSQVTVRHYNILQSSTSEHAAEVQRLKESHQMAMELQHKEFEDALYRMKEVKRREVDSIENFQSTSKSLHLVIEQIQANAKDLNSFQHKLDQWQIEGLDEREMTLRSRDQQLKFLQERLNRQQEENSRERNRLEELICRLEAQLHSQTQLLDDERWKMKQEVNKYHALQASIEIEKKQWVEQQAREKAVMERSRTALMDEQRQLMSQLFEERRALAEEKVQIEIARKLWTEREQQNSIKAVKIETEFDATMKALEEERNKSSVQQDLIEAEKKALQEERKKFDKECKNLDDEKTHIAEMASQMKKRSKEVESLFSEAQRMKEEGEVALAKSNKMDLEYSQRWKDLMSQMDTLTEQEKQLSAERITFAQERDHLETLRKNLMCINCRNSLSGGTATVNARNPKMTSTFTPTNTGSAFWGGYQPETFPIQATEDSSPMIQDTLYTIRTDQWLRQIKKQSLKDKEFILGERIYLAKLENSHYQPV